MCVSVSTCAHGLVCLCVQETSWGGQSLWRDNGLSLKWSSLFVCLCLLALGEDLQGEGWSQRGSCSWAAKTSTQQCDLTQQTSRRGRDGKAFSTPPSGDPCATQARVKRGRSSQRTWQG